MDSAQRVWDPYLDELDRAHVHLDPPRRRGWGVRPVLLMVDLYRAAFGHHPEPLLESVKTWPASCGLNGWTALPALTELLERARAFEIPVIHIAGADDLPNWREDAPRGSGFSEGDQVPRPGDWYDIVDEVAPGPGELILRKVAPSAFWGTPLTTYLTQLRADTVVIAGQSTSGCVRATVVDARSHGFKVVVVEDAVFDRHIVPHAINLFDIDQKYADVLSLREVVTHLSGAQHA